jgi:transposase-like protein
MVVKIGGRRMFLWRAVDSEGEVLDMLVQKRRNKAAALRLLRKLLRGQGIRPETIVTDGLSSYGAALSAIGLARRHRPGRLRANNRAENSHLPIRKRERMMQTSCPFPA